MWIQPVVPPTSQGQSGLGLVLIDKSHGHHIYQLLLSQWVMIWHGITTLRDSDHNFKWQPEKIDMEYCSLCVSPFMGMNEHLNILNISNTSLGAKLAAATAAKSLQSCPTLCDPTDSTPPGSSVPGILQARILEWVAISFSNVLEWKVKVKSLSRVRPLATPWTVAYQAPPPMGFSRQKVLEWVAIAFSRGLSLYLHKIMRRCSCKDTRIY